MKKIGLAGLALLLAGCATTAKLEARLNTYIGKPAGAVVSAFGPPHSSYSLPDGTSYLSYARNSTMVLPGATTVQPVTTNTTGTMTLNRGYGMPAYGNYQQSSTTYVSQQGPAIPVNLNCTINFTIDKAGYVQQWSWNGNHCVSQ